VPVVPAERGEGCAAACADLTGGEVQGPYTLVRTHPRNCDLQVLIASRGCNLVTIEPGRKDLPP